MKGTMLQYNHYQLAPGSKKKFQEWYDEQEVNPQEFKFSSYYYLFRWKSQKRIYGLGHMPDYIRNFVLLQETFQLESTGQNPKSLQRLKYVSLLYSRDLVTSYLKNMGDAMSANALNSNPLKVTICWCIYSQINTRPSLHTDFHSFAHLQRSGWLKE